MGWAIVVPGTRTRKRALSEEALAAVQIALGTAPWLVVAGILEGNRAHFAKAGLPVVIGTGVLFGGLWWGLLFWRGRRPRVVA
jgi:predicted TIM-barrel enzyme